MRKRRDHSGFLLVSIVILGSLSQACASAWLRVSQIPEDGYESTLNYQFQARVLSDSLGQCKKIVVRVKALNKLYVRDKPPARLQLFDDDCMNPLRFERLQYISNTGQQVRLSGIAVVHFFSDNVRLEDELMGWLWRKGVM